MTDRHAHDRSGPDEIDPALWRGLTQSRMSRRTLLRGAGASLGALAGGSLLAACGGVAGAGSKRPSTNKNAVAAYWDKQHKHGHFVFANWPLYMDVNPNNKSDHPSIDTFTKQTGIKVNYLEVIQDDDTFIGKIEPVLAAGQSTGYDLMVIENGPLYIAKLKEAGWLVPLDHKYLPNFAKYAASKVKSPSYDPGNEFTVAWQSGFTGIGYDPERCGREITSFEDLFDPKFKGKVGMMADIMELPNFALNGMGINSATSTPADWKRAKAKLEAQKNAGMVRKYYQQDYVQALSSGDIWLSMAWSGDIYQSNLSGSKLKFVVPKEGGNFWTDNMCIPKGAHNPVDSITYMNYCYDPRAAATMAEGINYITPVPSAQKYIESDAAKASGADKRALEYLDSSPLIFPTAGEYARTHTFRELTKAQIPMWENMFEPIYQS
jgi:spermidine/putrescine transport system substrate-binding protein